MIDLVASRQRLFVTGVMVFVFQTAVFISYKTVFVRENFCSYRYQRLISKSVCHVPVAVKFDGIQTFDNLKIVCYILYCSKNIGFPFIIQYTMRCIEMPGKTFVIVIVNGRKEILVVVAESEFEINGSIIFRFISP